MIIMEYDVPSGAVRFSFILNEGVTSFSTNSQLETLFTQGWTSTKDGRRRWREQDIPALEILQQLIGHEIELLRNEDRRTSN